MSQGASQGADGGARVGVPQTGPASGPGARLRRLRLERGLSLNELSRLTHYSKGYLSKIETDEKTLTPGVAHRCDEALETGGELAELVARVAEACPYRGLSAYEPEDSRWFFGRERAIGVLVGWLAEHIRGRGPLVVVAPSGAGKSSLLRAGLLPAVRRGALPAVGSRTWPAILFTPGERPVDELLARVGAAVGLAAQVLGRALAEDPAVFAARVRAALNGPRTASHVPNGLRKAQDHANGAGGPNQMSGPPGAGGPDHANGPGGSGGRGRVPGTERRLVLVVDQLEEIFTLCGDQAERRVFLTAVHALAARLPAGDPARGPAALVVLGVRADFYGHCLSYPDLVASLRDGQLPLGPMTLPELREVITGPARAAGLTLEPGLVELLLRDMGVPPELDGSGAGPAHEPGTLPLLSHALLTTWQHRRGDVLTVEGYRLTGGIGGAVAATAEHVFSRLDAHRREIARRLLLRMVCVGEDNAETRRPVDVRQLPETHFPVEATAEVIASFTAARLLTADADHVRLAHEALLRAWPRLREWIHADRVGLRTHRQLSEAAHEWEREGRDPSLLYRGTRLQTAHDWAAGGDAALTAMERRFLDAGLAARAAERAAVRRRARRLRHLVVTLTVLLVLATATGVFAMHTRQTATRQRDVTLSQRIAVEATGLRTADPALAAQLSLASYRLSPTDEARGSLLTAFTAPYANRLTGGDDVNKVVFSPDGRTLVTAGDDGVRLWDVTNPHRPREPVAFAGDGADVESVALSGDGRKLVTAGFDGSVRLWDVSDRRRPRPLAVFAGRPLPVWSVAFSSDGRTVATAGDDRTTRLWDVSDPRRPRPLATLTGHVGVVRGVALSPDDRLLVSTGDDNTARLWDVSDPRRPRFLDSLTGHDEDIWAVVFSPDGRTLATGSDDRTARLWDLSRPGSPRSLAVLRDAHTGPVVTVAFAPDGRSLVTGGWDHTAVVWALDDPANPRPATALNGHSNTVGSAAFSPDGRVLATGSWDHTTRLWDVSGPIARGHTGAARAAAFTPDGRILATAGDDRKVRLWDVTDLYRPTPLGAPTGPTGTYHAVAFSSDGRILAAGGEDETVRLWDVSDPKAPVGLPTLTEPTARVRTVAFAGRMLAGAGFDNTVRLWSLADPRRPVLTAELPGHGNAVYSVAFSPDGRMLASGGFDNTVRLWSLADPRHPVPTFTLEGHTSAVYSVAFSPDGRTLASASFDQTARLWDLTRPHRPNVISTLTGHRAGVSSVAFGPGGGTLATAGDDRTVRLWDLADLRAPEPLAQLTGHTDAVRVAAFNPGGGTLATASADRTIRLWDPDAERVAARICALAHPGITRSEWERHFPGPAYRPPCPAPSS
ncbi:WD40 repeat protein/transcriptional regulator with XRE-family HTH domain [Streptosporangium becharense]|uniref:WD40 repeat protein/transcriptional regulator with XRE-family HTH domain n=1 Tax=Streptosporangium becharense TaxID=1816182 RepID=A0A7W9ILF0_9ACTN|nr:helix-turn-helix domain-containing protein [Streptosporangium becharense]MBB2911711.1 WD40 repeat protein/transcriptional regulator with XRE-family HTH domain [Streptosporangium becharense]MBB5822471.1 WD40 repeat protein/transcriptional regulator with XRE-family HTH domain [Streptosporangium becharense]